MKLKILFLFLGYCLAQAQLLPRYTTQIVNSGSKIKLPDSLRKADYVEVCLIQPDGSSKKGVVSASGKIIVPIIHDTLVWLGTDRGYLTARPLNDTWAWGLRNPKGEIVLREEYQAISPGKALILAKPPLLRDGAPTSAYEFWKYDGKRFALANPDSAFVLSNGEILLYRSGLGETILNSTSATRQYIKKHSIENKKSVLAFFPQWQININSTTSLSFVADSLVGLNDSLVKLQRNALWGVLGLDKKNILPFQFDSIHLVNSRFLFAKRNDSTCVYDLSGTLIIRKSPNVWMDTKGYFHVLDSMQKWKIANQKGAYLSTFSFSETGLLSNALLAAKTDSAWGYLHVSGKWQILPKYKSASDFKYGYALVESFPGKHYRYALIDRNDSIYFINQEALLYYYEMVEFRTCADTSNAGEPKTEMVYPFPPYRYEHIQPWIPGYYITQNGSLKGVLNSKGKEIVYCHQDTIYLPSENDSIFLYKRRNGSFGISDKYGNRTLYTNFYFQNVRPFHNGLARFRLDGAYGFIDIYGNVRISPQYTTIGEFSSNHVAVMIRGKWGYLTNQERIKIQPYYQEVLPARNNLAIVRQGKKWEFLSTESGSKINVTSYEQFTPLKSGRYLVYKGKKVGLTNSSGKEIIFPKYEAIYELTENTFAVRRDGYYGVLDDKENIIVNFQHSGISYHSSLGQYALKQEVRLESLDESR